MSNVSKSYNEQTAHYDSVIEKLVPDYATFNALISQVIGSPNTILDVGCGTGNTARGLLERHPAAKLTFSSTKMILAALVTFMVLFQGSASRAETKCSREELLWENWYAHLDAHNPGIRHTELEGEEREHILRYYGCDKDIGACPPDRVVICACSHKNRVLVVFVKNECVTGVKELLIEDLQRILKGQSPQTELGPKDRQNQTPRGARSAGCS